VGCSVRDGYGLTTWMLLDTRITDGRALLGGKTSDGQITDGLAARHSLLNARSTGSLFIVSRTVNQQGLTQIWNSLVFFNVD